MADNYVAPLMVNEDDTEIVDDDLSTALVFWSLESEREKGGGIFRKKEAEKVIQVSVLYRPILVKKYGNCLLAFDGCGVSSARFKFGVAPSLTYLRSYLISEDWPSKPESFTAGLERHAQEFERAHGENSYEIRGWITNPELARDLGNLLQRSVVTESEPEALPQLMDSVEVGSTLAGLDKIKHLMYSENAPLKDLKQVLSEKSSEVLVPLNEECSRIERDYDSRIERIRPSVLESKQRFESQRASQIQQIEARNSRRLHELRNKLDAAQAKIDAYEYSERQPKGGIDRQYSLRDSTRQRIRDLEDDQEKQISAVNEKYDALVGQAQERIDALEEEKERQIEGPRSKLQGVKDATSRLNRAIDQLIEDHDTITKMEASSSIARPAQLDMDNFMFYVPTIIARFDDGKKPRTEVFSVGTLKGKKGAVGTLKSVVGMRSSPLEKPNENLDSFAASFMDSPKVNSAALLVAKRNNMLLNAGINKSITSGTAKLVARGLIKQKEAAEFQTSVDSHFIAAGPEGPTTEGVFAEATTVERERKPIIVRFVSYRGTEKWVGIDELEVLREQDKSDFGKEAPSISHGGSQSARLLEYMRNLKIPYTKQYCIDHREDWVQNMLHAILANSEYRHALHRERTFDVGVIEARIDFDVGGVGVEVKIFRSMEDFNRLTKEMLVYGEEYREILIPYINAGGISNEQLEAELRLLSKHYSQVKGFFQLNCRESV